MTNELLQLSAGPAAVNESASEDGEMAAVGRRTKRSLESLREVLSWRTFYLGLI